MFSDMRDKTKGGADNTHTAKVPGNRWKQLEWAKTIRQVGSTHKFSDTRRELKFQNKTGSYETTQTKQGLHKKDEFLSM